MTLGQLGAFKGFVRRPNWSEGLVIKKEGARWKYFKDGRRTGGYATSAVTWHEDFVSALAYKLKGFIPPETLEFSQKQPEVYDKLPIW